MTGTLHADDSLWGLHDKESELPLAEMYDFEHKKKNELSINEEKQRILNVIQSSRVSIVTGPTGCGKTTQVPQFILEHYATQRPGERVNIVVTQPRRIAAQSVARRVCEERGWNMPRPVGYKVGMDREHCGPDTRLLYCTTGVLKKMVIGE